MKTIYGFIDERTIATLLRNVSLIFVQWYTCIVHSIQFILISMFDVQNNRAIICIQMWYDSTYPSTHWILVTVFFSLLVLIVIVAMVVIIVVAGDVTLFWITHRLLLKMSIKIHAPRTQCHHVYHVCVCWVYNILILILMIHISLMKQKWMHYGSISTTISASQ